MTDKGKDNPAVRKQIINTLASFEKIKEWADVGHWLQKIARQLEEYKSPNIPEKITFSKRLAQCLNPTLPHGVHLNALQVYRIIFENMKKSSLNWAEDIALFSIGLFPFFQYAAFQVKPVVLELFREYFFPLGRQLIPCVSGLVVSLLPGLDEQNEELRKNVQKTLDNACECVGRRYFIGAIWLAILRTPKIRIAGLKYLSKKIEKHQNELLDEQPLIDKIEEEKYQDLDSNTTTQKVMQQVQNYSNILDNNNNISKQQIGENDISLLHEKDEESFDQVSTQYLQEIKEKQNQILLTLEKGINDDNDENNYPNKNSLVINALIACLEDENVLVQRHALDFFQSHLKLEYDLFSSEKKVILIEAGLYILIKKDLSLTRRIYTWLFGAPDLENKYNLTPKNQFVLKFIIIAFKNIFENVPSNHYEATMPLKILQNFYMEHEHLVESTLKELSLSIIKYIYVNHKGKEYSAEVMKSGERFMENIPSNFGLILDSLSEVMSTEISKKNDAKCLEILHLVEFAFEKLLIQQQGQDKIRQVDFLKVLISGIFRTTQSLTAEDIVKFSFIQPAIQLSLKLIDNLGRGIEATGPNYYQNGRSNEINNQFEANLSIYCKYFTKVADYILQRDNDSELHQRYFSVFNTLCKIIIKIQKYISKFPKDLPSWFISLAGCIKSSRPQISLPASDAIIEIVLYDRGIPSLLNIKVELNNELRARNLPRKQGQSINTGRMEVIRSVIQKLWGLLDHNYYIGKVIDLISNFQNVYSDVFSDMLTTSFTSNNLGEKELAIRRFATFWKLTGEQQNYQNIYIVDIVLFNMLEFLDNDNPLLRLSCKTWLVDSMPLLQRILDPMFEVLLKPNDLWYVTDSKQYFYTKEYDTKRVHDVFKKLKSILITAGELFVKYISSIKISQKMKDIRLNFGTENDYTQLQECTYLDLLIIICLKYAQGQAVESISSKFYQDNSTVNASACEFLELLIKKLEYNDLSLKVTYQVIEPTLYLLQHSNTNEDYVLQVQLLSLIKTILFQSQFQNLKNQNEISVLLSSKMFIPNFLCGLDSKLPSYLRVQFIGFITTCIQPLTKYLNPRELTKAVYQEILVGFFNVIKEKKQNKNILEDDLEDDERLVEIQLNYESNYSNELQGYSDDVCPLSFDKKEEGQNETAIILDNIKQILVKFLELKETETNTHDTQLDKDQSGVFGSMKDWLFGGSSTTQVINQEIKEVEHVETRNAILHEIIQLIQNYLLCWKTSKNIQETADFTQMGIPPYSFDNFKEFNKSLVGQYQQQQKFSKSIKNQILSVMKSLNNQYTINFYNSILNLWIDECAGVFSADNTVLIKIIDILVSMKITPEYFINSLAKSIQIQYIIEFYEKKKKEGKKNIYVLDYALGLAESRLLFLLYTFLCYVQTDGDSLHRSYLSILWFALLKFTKIFEYSKHPNTLLWVLEILYIASQKYNPKEIINDSKIKEELHDYINSLLTHIAQIAAKQTIFYYNTPELQKVGIYKLIQPYPPTIYGLYSEYKMKQSQGLSNNEHDSEIDYEIENIMFENLEDTSEASIINRYRFFCFKTLKNIGLSILQNTYSPERTDRIVVRAKEYMEYIFPLLEKKEKRNQLFLECASEVLYQQLDIGRMFLLKEYKRYILDVFLANDFFKCNKRTLKLWSRIIDWLVTMDKGDLFSEMLNKVSSFSFIISRDTETKQKIKNFERVCFMIYSGDRDKYQGKLRILLEKMSEVIKNADNSPPALLILIMFCIRILILRLSSTTLGELFRNIWPMLLTLLISIFNKKTTTKNPNLILAALKLIELMSIVGLEEFYLHQWVFVFDYFGLEMEYYYTTKNPSVNSTNIKKHSNTPTAASTKTFNSPFIFQPYITNSIPEDFIIDYINKQREVQKKYSKRPRAIIMTQSNVIDEIEIKNKALSLCQYLISNNEFRSVVDPLKIESLIEGDFISLDDYIFDLN